MNFRAKNRDFEEEQNNEQKLKMLNFDHVWRENSNFCKSEKSTFLREKFKYLKIIKNGGVFGAKIQNLIENQCIKITKALIFGAKIQIHDFANFF